MNLGIEKVYRITKKVRRNLILNDKVIDYLFETAKKRQYVLMLNSSSYEEITRDIIKELLEKAQYDEDYWDKDCFAIVDEYPEYEGIPFEVEHASPYDHRWPGDYDPDAYEDWKIRAYSLSNLLYEDNWDHEPVFAKHPEKFDFEDAYDYFENEKFEDTNYYWHERLHWQ